MAVELSDAFFAKIAGWDVMKRARSLVAQGQVLSSNWTAPLLKGVVQEGGISYRAGLVIKDAVDVENICHCRTSKEWGTMCAHSIGVGLHHLKSVSEAQTPALDTKSIKAAVSPTKGPSGERLQRSVVEGERAELHIILPPNVEQAITRGKIMLVLEAEWNGGRGPLNVLPKGKTFRLSEQDARLLDEIESIAGGVTPPMLMVESADFARLLMAMVDHENITLGKSTPVQITGTPWTPPITATLEDSGEIRFKLREKTAPPVFVERKWVYRDKQFQPMGVPASLKEIFTGEVSLKRSAIPAFLSQEWPVLERAGNVAANFSLADFSLEPQTPKFILELKGGIAQLEALLQCAYGNRIITLGLPDGTQDFWLPDPENPRRYGTRDLGAERAAIGRLTRSGFTGPDPMGRYKLLGQNQVLTFFAREYPRLQREWQVSLEERLQRSANQNLERIEPRFQVTPSGVQWFDLSIDFSSTTGERFSPADIQRLVLSGQNYARLKNGKFALIDTGAVEELQEVLVDCAPQQHAEGYRLNNAQAAFLQSTLGDNPAWKINAPPAWKERFQSFTGAAEMSCPPLGQLEEVLRPYQKKGVGWLCFLRQNQFGGILADEMGLGKTLQALAFLQSIARAREISGPALIVCPTSLVFNWVAEAARFTPTLKTLALTGSGREALFPEIPRHNLVVTSYALIRRDAEKYREHQFNTVVLDEAQHIKNRQTQNAQAVKSIRAAHRIVLTGTPIENSVLDLWSIFDFLMPGYLGSAQDFRERYEIPITQHKNAEAQKRLSRRLRPFILRRVKAEVARELPAKLEQVAWCELTDDQRAVYSQLMDTTRKEVMEAVGEQGVARSRMIVLNALLRLRQVCCDLRLLNLENVDPAGASAKTDLFEELLEEILDGNHRVLVFSQFVSMLTILREKLAQREIDYCYLDGSTGNRGEVVQRFQTNTAIPVFLISLKAGGVGLNLTGADTVIHFDPWWNPAVEDQATDRAHRIGQTKVVTSYKLITRGTVEEKILTLQNRKREIIAATLNEEELTNSLTWDEIQELLT